MTLTAQDVYRDFVTDNVPSSGKINPPKSDIRKLLTGYETQLTAMMTQALVYTTRALLYADLAHAANSMAWVVADATPAYCGIYQKSGASGSGSWTRVADLPHGLIVATDAGAGTANAIQATTAIDVTTSSLVMLTFYRANTATNVSVSFNGGTAYAIRTAAGNDPVAGACAAGMTVLAKPTASYELRLLTDISGASVQAAAEAAAGRAETAQAAAEAAAAGLHLPTVTASDAGDTLVIKDDGSGYRVSEDLTAYLGQVATRCGANQNATTVNKQMMSRSRHFARDTIATLQLVYPNWYLTLSDEVGSGGSITVSAAIEYPEGNFRGVTWSGATSISIADGANSPASDPVLAGIPEGAEFFVRTYMSSSNGIVWIAQKDYANGERCAFGPSGIVDQTMTGDFSAIPDNGQKALYRPLAIIAQTKKRSVLVLGDSRDLGIGDTQNDTSDTGDIERSISRACALINVSRSGMTAGVVIASHALRVAAAQYCSDVVIHLGINDAITSSTGAQIVADLRTIVGYFPGKRVWTATLEPVTSSTDGWTTLSNQTVAASNTARLYVNAAIRGGLSGYTGYFDIAAVVEDVGTNAGKWRVYAGKAITGDGTHANTLGYQVVQDSGAVDPRQFFSVPDRKPKFASALQATAGSASGVPVDPAALGGRPRFKVVKGGVTTNSQTVPSDTQTVLVFAYELFDIGDFFNTTTSRYVPPAGVYRLKGLAGVTAGIADGVLVTLSILKNGTVVSQKFMRTSGASYFSIDHDDIVEANGTDYFELAFQMGGSGDKTVSGNNYQTFFEGHAL